MGCNNKATTLDGYCSDQCRKDDYEEELGFQRISHALNKSKAMQKEEE